MAWWAARALSLRKNVVFKVTKNVCACTKLNLRTYSTGTDTYDPYEVLKVEPGASLEEIRKSYIKLSKKFHPDYNPGNEKAEEQFVRLTSAYRKLVEKVAKEQAENQSEASKDEEKVKLKYDFTITALGVETEEVRRYPHPKEVFKLAFYGSILFLCGAFFFKIYILGKIEKGLQEWRPFQKTQKQLEDDAAERIRQRTIKKYEKQQMLKELYERGRSR